MKWIQVTVCCIFLALLNSSFAANTDGCGELTLKLKGGTEEVKFPRGPSQFTAQTECIITVSAPEKPGVSVTIPQIDIPKVGQDCNTKGYVQASNKNEKWEAVPKHCGSDAVKDAIKSDGDLYVRIVILNVDTMPSFTLKFSSEPTAAQKAAGCGELQVALTGGQQEFMYPTGGKFSDYTQCVITFTPPGDSKLNMTIPTIKIPETKDCDNGYVQASDKLENLDTVGKHCKDTPVLTPIMSNGNIYVKIAITKASENPSFTLRFMSDPTPAQKAAGCGNLDVALTEGEKEFTYPMGGKFSDYTECIITFTPPADFKVSMTIPTIKIPQTASECDNGFVQASNKTEELDMAPKHCQTTPVETPITSDGKMFVKVTIKDASKDPSFTLKFVSGARKFMTCPFMVVLLTSVTSVLGFLV